MSHCFLSTVPILPPSQFSPRRTILLPTADEIFIGRGGNEKRRGEGYGKLHIRRRRGASLDMVLTQKVSEKIRETLFTQYSKKWKDYLIASPMMKISTRYWMIVPKLLRQILLSLNPADFMFLVLFKISYKKILKLAHNVQMNTCKLMNLQEPLEYEKSIIGFIEKRSKLFVRLLGFNYVVKLALKLLIEIGFRIRPDVDKIISNLAYLFYAGNFLDLFKSKYVHLFFPSLTEDRRKNYVFNRSVSVALWFVNFLIACEMISTYLKVPLSSTLAFGGVGGVALGLSAKDIAANYLGGMLLLFNEPFTPGDMVNFKIGKDLVVGRVERVGWGQTRIRGRDTRPTYIPNSQFVQTAVTNMDRITHRKYEARIPLRFQDQDVLPDVLSLIRETLRTIPKLDTLSMPYRVHFVGFGQFSLDVEITCYFATKSVDEFLSLQQVANIEVLKAIRLCGANLALPTTVLLDGKDQNEFLPSPQAIIAEKPAVDLDDINIPSVISNVVSTAPLSPAVQMDEEGGEYVSKATITKAGEEATHVREVLVPNSLLEAKSPLGNPPSARELQGQPSTTYQSSVSTATLAQQIHNNTNSIDMPTIVRSTSTAEGKVAAASVSSLPALSSPASVLDTNAPKFVGIKKTSSSGGNTAKTPAQQFKTSPKTTDSLYTSRSSPRRQQTVNDEDERA